MSPRTLQRWLKDGDAGPPIPISYVRGRVRASIEELDKWYMDVLTMTKRSRSIIDTSGMILLNVPGWMVLATRIPTT